MSFLIILFIIIYLLILGMDRYFHATISNILDIKGFNSQAILKSLGYYNESIFTNRLHGIVIAFIISMIIYGIYLLFKRRRDKELNLKIREVEKDLICINRGDYSIEIKEDDEYSILRDELYKTIVNLKSLEEESERQKSNLKKDLANIAHQLKTPITSIGFMMELIEIEYIGEDFNILGDDIWLYEGFLNIIKNSIEYTRDKLSIELRSNPIYKEIKIKDNGKGLEKESIDKIFDRFYRGNTSIKGYGIGLNLSKTIIENHNGEIEVYNDNGLIFQIKFYNVT